jgi:GT2 family glycosyltransferase
MELAFAPKDFEVIVVDDGSPTVLDALVQQVASARRILLLRKTHGGPASARNAGAKMARGRFLAFTDDDCRVEPGWLANLEARLRHGPEQMVGGPVVNKLAQNPYAVASQVILNTVYAHYNPDPEDASFFASNNMAMSTELFLKVGGFDAGFPRAAAEDRDICNRWRHAGHKMTYAPEAIVYHHHDLTLRGFWRQHFNYGSGAWQYHARRARRRSGRLTRDLMFHAHLPRLLRPSFSVLEPRQKIAVGALLAIWQTANAAGFLSQALRTSRRTKPLHREVDALREPVNEATPAPEQGYNGDRRSSAEPADSVTVVAGAGPGDSPHP